MDPVIAGHDFEWEDSKILLPISNLALLYETYMVESYSMRSHHRHRTITHAHRS